MGAVAKRRIAPATTPVDRENQLISLATDLAEKQLTAGTASSQVLTHFLKMGSERETLERLKIERENLLLSAKIDQMASARRIEELYETALMAMRQYSGQDSLEEFDYDEGSDL